MDRSTARNSPSARANPSSTVFPVIIAAFPDPIMRRLLRSASDKVMIFQVEGLLDDEETT